MLVWHKAVHRVAGDMVSGEAAGIAHIDMLDQRAAHKAADRDMRLVPVLHKADIGVQPASPAAWESVAAVLAGAAAEPFAVVVGAAEQAAGEKTAVVLPAVAALA